MHNKRIQIPVVFSDSKSIEEELYHIFIKRASLIVKEIDDELVEESSFSLENGSPEAYAERLLTRVRDLNVIAINLKDTLKAIRRMVEGEIENG